MRICNLPKVSIIVPAYNVEKTIDKCIESLINQTYPNIEIIVIDDGSEDRTIEVASKYSVKLIRTLHQGEGHARNEGIKHATGEIIFQGEADGFYAPDYIELCIKHLIDNPNIGTVIGRGHPWPDSSVLWKWWCENYNLRQINYKPIGGWFFRKEDIQKIGLYDESLERGTDVDLCNRLRLKMGCEFIYEPRAEWWHKEPYSLSGLFKKSKKVGRGIINYYQKQGINRKILVFSLAFVAILLLLGYVLLLTVLNILPFHTFAIIPSLLAFDYAIPLFRVKQKGQGLYEYRHYILLYPIVQVLTTLGFSLGYINGYIRRMLDLKTES